MKNYTFILLCSLALAGCGEEEEVTSETADTDSLKSDALSRAAYPAGRFEADPPGSGPFVSVTLRPNGLFDAEQNVVCTRTPCELPRIEGRYKFTRAGEKRYLHLTASDGVDVRWTWQKFGDELQIRKAGATAWAVLGHVAIE